MKHNTTQHNSKGYLLILLVAMCVFTVTTSKAQNYANDRVLAAPLYVSPTPAPAPLAYSSNAYLTKYGRYEYHIPDASTPEKTIKLNINVFLDNAGGNNWPNNATTNAKFAQIIDDINTIYGNNADPTDPIAGVVDIIDTKIRFELANVYYYVNGTLNIQDPTIANSNISQDLINVIGNASERLNALNICLTNYIPPANTPTSITTLPTLGASGNLSIVSFGTWNNGGTVNNISLAHHWARQLGYCLDLKSTYLVTPRCADCNETCVTTDLDYLSDVFNYTTCLHTGSMSCNPIAAGNTCTNNIMGGTDNNDYFSPKQIGKMHRALAFKTTQRYVKDCAYNTTPKVITANETWDFGIKMYNDIVIEAPAVVTMLNINGANLILMPNNAKIIVKPGAKLHLDNSRITSGCDLMWSGIEVWGNPTQAQNTTSQGYLAIDHNSQIINARVGTRLYKDGQPTMYNGGVIQAENCKYINNYKGVEFYPYASPSGIANKSYFKNTGFESVLLQDPAYIDGAGRRYPMQYGIALNGVKGVLIYGCNFAYSLPPSGSTAPVVDIDLRGTGIYATNATFVVDKYSASALPQNTFSNLTKGIDATATLATVTNYISIKNCEFTNVQQGIQGTLNFGTIDQNTFNIPNFTSTSAGIKPWGVYLTGSKGFNITHNTFVGISPFATSNPNYGVIIKGSNSFGGTIGFNDFNNITIANQTEDNNPYLQIKCNTYTNHFRAWNLNPGANQANCTFIDQGTSCGNNGRANNTFNDACNYVYDHIFSYLNYVFTYYGTGPVSMTNVLSPLCTYGNIQINSCPISSNDKSCYEAPPCTTSACAGAQRIKMNAETKPITKLQLANEALRMYSALGETTGVIDVLTDLNTEDANKLLIAEYIATNNITAATTLLNNLDISAADNKAFYDYHTIVLQLAQGNTPTPAQLATLTTLANSGTEVSANAQAMLSSINGTVINRSPNVDVNAEYKITVVKQLPTTINVLKVNPNPFNETATVNINLTVSNATLQLRTVLGEVIQKHNVQEGENTIVINKNNLAQGMYVLVLVQENKVIATQKIVINQ